MKKRNEPTEQILPSQAAPSRYRFTPPVLVTVKTGDLEAAIPHDQRLKPFPPDQTVDLPAAEIFTGNVPKISLRVLSRLLPDHVAAADAVIVLPVARLAAAYAPVEHAENGPKSGWLPPWPNRRTLRSRCPKKNGTEFFRGSRFFSANRRRKPGRPTSCPRQKELPPVWKHLKFPINPPAPLPLRKLSPGRLPRKRKTQKSRPRRNRLRNHFSKPNPPFRRHVKSGIRSSCNRFS